MRTVILPDPLIHESGCGLKGCGLKTEIMDMETRTWTDAPDYPFHFAYVLWGLQRTGGPDILISCELYRLGLFMPMPRQLQQMPHILLVVTGLKILSQNLKTINGFEQKI